MSVKINKEALIDVLEHIQSRTDCLLINGEVYGTSKTGERIIQKIENKAFDIWSNIKDDPAKELKPYQILEAKDLYQGITLALANMKLGADMTFSEISSWKWELEQALYGKTHEEILHGYLDKFIPKTGKIIEAEEVQQDKPKIKSKKASSGKKRG